MGFHDTLAIKAYENGHRAEHFKAAAQYKANAFWVWLIIAVVVGWFAKGYWWVIPAALCAWRGWESLSATLVRTRLEQIEKGSEPTT